MHFMEVHPFILEEIEMWDTPTHFIMENTMRKEQDSTSSSRMKLIQKIVYPK